LLLFSLLFLISPLSRGFSGPLPMDAIDGLDAIGFVCYLPLLFISVFLFHAEKSTIELALRQLISGTPLPSLLLEFMSFFNHMIKKTAEKTMESGILFAKYLLA
jgi:hypothetical protein